MDIYNQKYLDMIKENITSDKVLLDIIQEIYQDGFEDGVNSFRD